MSTAQRETFDRLVAESAPVELHVHLTCKQCHGATGWSVGAHDDGTDAGWITCDECDGTGWMSIQAASGGSSS